MSIYAASHPRLALKHPLAALSFYMGNKEAMHSAVILSAAKHLLQERFQPTPWRNALREIEQHDFIPPRKNDFNIVVGNSLNTSFGKWLYCCVRVFQPGYLIETGVSHGSSSWILLNALHKNGKGKLFSIDLPNNDTNSAYNFSQQPTTGWMVPDTLKSIWELHLGDAREILPALLKQCGNIDMFFHDSDHSYSHMQFEFATVAPFLSSHGLLISDDVHKNAAFPEFVEQHRWRALQFNKGGTAIAP